MTRAEIYRLISGLSNDKAAKVVSYAQAMYGEEEPLLNEDEEEGLRIAYAELAFGQGQLLKDAIGVTI